ncbi:MAG: hypothetical protein ACRDR6_12215 [Pseudonocardiaceae bacterium]
MLTRSREIAEAASETWLVGAVAVHLHDVTPPDAVDYLQRARTGPPPEGWTDLLTHLGEHPDGVLARGLSTPLTLTLLRDTYQAGDDVRELLDPTRYPTTEAIERDLIARVLPAAYTPRPGRPPPRYTEAQARQTLSFIARKMGKDRDLAWWHIPRWAPDTPRVLATGLVFGLLGGLMGVLVGLVVGGPVSTSGRGEYRVRIVTQRVRIANWRAAISRQTLREALTVVFLVGDVVGLTAGIVVGVTLGIVVGLTLGIAVAFIDRSPAPDLAMGPRQAWRNGRLSGLSIGLVYGLVFGLVFGLIGGLGIGLEETGPTTLAWFQLQLARQVPTVSLIPFLEDARERDILRTVGAVYQFRHATLQDQLAAVQHSSQTLAKRPPQPS